jgi:2-acylglycerol O-acyltransferase 2
MAGSDAKKEVKKATVTMDFTDAKPPGFSHHAALWVWIGWITFYLVFLISLPFLYLYAKWLLGAILGILLISFVYPVERKIQPKVRCAVRTCDALTKDLLRISSIIIKTQWGWKLAEWAMRRAAEYFKMKVVVEDVDALKASAPCIFALEPHDVLPVSYFSFNDFFNALPGHSCRGTITSICFSTPLLKHMYTWVNAISVDKQSIVSHLKSGVSVIICPGGVTEVALKENEDECVLFLKSRLGFVKLALQFGLPIVPVFSFGLHNAYSAWIPKSKTAKWLAKKVGFMPMIFFGVYGIPYGPAKPCKLANVIGVPIKCPKIEEPSEEDIKKYHAIYLVEIERIYEAYKKDFGMENIKLRIV